MTRIIVAMTCLSIVLFGSLSPTPKAAAETSIAATRVMRSECGYPETPELCVEDGGPQSCTCNASEPLGCIEPVFYQLGVYFAGMTPDPDGYELEDFSVPCVNLSFCESDCPADCSSGEYNYYGNIVTWELVYPLNGCTDGEPH